MSFPPQQNYRWLLILSVTQFIINIFLLLQNIHLRAAMFKLGSNKVYTLHLVVTSPKPVLVQKSAPSIFPQTADKGLAFLGEENLPFF